MFGIGDIHLPMSWGTLDWEEFATLPFGPGTIANMETPELAPGAQIASVAAAKLFQKTPPNRFQYIYLKYENLGKVELQPCHVH